MKSTLQKLFLLLSSRPSHTTPGTGLVQGKIKDQIKEAVRESNLDQQKVLKEYKEKFSAAR